MSDVKISWGLDIDIGIMRYIADVPSGLACNCKCPGCDSPLIARKGEKNKWCFAHSVTGDCNGESALHRAAKQILVKEAILNNELQLPYQQQSEVSDSDCIGFKYSRTVTSKESEFFLMLNGREEVRVSDNIQTDVLLFGEDNKTLSVEIFVTHKKNDNDQFKYSVSQQDGIEIDLSKLRWDSDYEAIKKAVLWDAPRGWVYSEDLEKRISFAKNELERFVSEKNAKYFSEISNFVSSLKSTEHFQNLNIQWPVLSGEAFQSTKDEDYPSSSKVEQVVTIQTIDANWSKIDNIPCWVCGATAKVNKNVLVDLMICLENTDLRQIKLTRPTFVCILGYKSSNDSIKILRSEWRNIAAWEKRLQELAEKKLNAEIMAIENQYKNSKQFARDFLASSPNDKMAFLARQLKIAVPQKLGRYFSHWNAHELIWKSLVLYYKIQKAKRDSVNTKGLAEDLWLKAMTDWPNDDESVKKRSFDLWHWFRELEKEGRVKHASRLWFSIIKPIAELE